MWTRMDESETGSFTKGRVIMGDEEGHGRLITAYEGDKDNGRTRKRGRRWRVATLWCDTTQSGERNRGRVRRNELDKARRD